MKRVIEHLDSRYAKDKDSLSYCSQFISRLAVIENILSLLKIQRALVSCKVLYKAILER